MSHSYLHGLSPDRTPRSPEEPDATSTKVLKPQIANRRVSVPVNMRLASIIEQDEKDKVFFKRKKSIQIDPETKRIIFEKERKIPTNVSDKSDDDESEDSSDEDERDDKNKKTKSSTCVLL